MADVACLPIVLLEYMNALLEYFNREFYFMEIMLKIAGIMLNSFYPFIIPKIIKIAKKMTGKFFRAIDSCLVQWCFTKTHEDLP